MRRTLGIIAILLVASFGFADTSKAGATSMNTTLQINATVTTAISFTLANGTGGNCLPNTASASDPNYTISFGNVDGLGLGNGTNGTCTSVTKAAVTGGYLYTVPYKYTVHYSGFSASSGTTITAWSSNTTSSVKVYEGATAGSAAALSTTSTTPTAVATAGIATGTTSSDRVIGLFVPEDNSTSAAAGSYQSNVTFVVTPQ